MQLSAAMCCRKYLTLYSRLSKEAQMRKQCAWVIKPKCHMFQEMVEFQSFELGNPRVSGSTRMRIL